MTCKKLFALAAACLSLTLTGCQLNTEQNQNQKPSLNRTNVVLITADDLGYEVVKSLTEDPSLPNLTPNIDAFAKQGFQFKNAYVNTSICQPSRSIIATGQYGISSGMMGFFHMKKRSATVMQTLQDNGYHTGVLGKVSHSTPDMAFVWDYQQDYAQLGAGRSPEKYYGFTKTIIQQAKQANKPFYLMVNSHDPHRGFHNPNKPMKNAELPSALFTTEQVVVPNYLSDTPQVRTELSHYYNSVRRLDDTVGRVLAALQESGQRDNTLVMFLSDNGSAFPFAKANSYLASTKTPWIVQWPNGQVLSGGVNSDDFISTIDFFPTVLDALGLSIDNRVDGVSFMPLLKGQQQAGRSYVYTQIDYKIGGPATPMRSIQDKRYGYVFNPWSREGANYRNSNEGLITKEMAKSNDATQLARLKLFRERVVEEFFDLEADPDSTHNLIHHPDYQGVIDTYRQKLVEWMEQHNDPVLALYKVKDDPKRMQQTLKKHFPTKGQLMPEAQRLAKEEKAKLKKAKRQAKKREKKV